MDPNTATMDDKLAETAALAHFMSITWTAKYLESPGYRLVPLYSRYLKPTGEDAFFARTINTPTTIPYCLSLCRQDLALPEAGSPFNRTTSTSGKSSTISTPSVFDYLWLLHLAEPGINGHPKTAHGGVLACILDELTGMCANLHRLDRSIPLYTASLETTYKAPVFVPSNIVCTSWVTRKEGRKYWVRAQILDETGMLMTEGETLLIESKTKQKL
jgi:Thioesterase superfamily